MKFFFSEFCSNYKKYYFPYQVYLYKEEGDDLDKIYDMGFLPTRIMKNLFYLCRSLRINLKIFDLSSENRRILKKTDYIELIFKELSNLNYNYKIGKLGKDFYNQKFNNNLFSAYKIKWIFTSGAFSHTFEFLDKSKGKETIGYCPVIKTNKILHYAYPFYELNYFEKNLGMGMMLHSIVWAKNNNLDFVYLGTCYITDALYKLQFKGIEYFNGFEWSKDILKLKETVKYNFNGHLIGNMDKSIKSRVFEDKGIKI